MVIEYINTVVQDKKTNYDLGIRKYLFLVYRYMTFALWVTALVAFIVSSSQTLMHIMHVTGLKWVVAFAPLIMVFYMGGRLMSMSHVTAQVCLMVFAMLMGVSLSPIFLIFTGDSIIRTFLVTASTFCVMSIWGHNTEKDLSSIGSFLMMGAIGLLIAGIANIFLKSSVVSFVSSVLGVVIFTIFTAYDTQRIKELYYQNYGTEQLASKLAVYGSLTLYMDFVNLFVFLLQLIGVRKND